MCKDGVTRRIHELTTDGACHAILNHHNCVYETLEARPKALISDAVAYAAATSAPNEAVSKTMLSLHEFFLKPSFSWAPTAAQNAVCTWARHAAIVHLAVTVQPFEELPDDCAGDVLEFLEIEMTRAEALHILTHCSSPKARAWVRTIYSSIIAVSSMIVASIQLSWLMKGHILRMYFLLCSRQFLFPYYDTIL